MTVVLFLTVHLLLSYVMRHLQKKAGNPTLKSLDLEEAHHLQLFNQEKILRLFQVQVDAANQAYKMANLSPKDIDFVEVHDCFTIAELIDIEDLGFFQKGSGAQAVREGRTTLKGDIPVNPSGGLKSKGHPIGATGVGQVVEVFEQFTNKAKERTVKDAEIAMTHNFGATGASAAVHIFKKMK